GFEGAIYRFDGEAFTLVEATVAGLEGLADEDDGSLVTAEDGALYRRDGERLAPRLELRMSEAPAPLVRWGSDFLMAAGFDRPDGQVFAAELAVLDATSASGAVTRGVIAIPVDATVIAGLSAGPEGVYVLGAGYGTDVRHLITLEVR
ncbi:MAG: hypothetical protein KC613_07025, partial [Myxococcales bacterium]|nr:hypothetical protein [Myxococcales bacterium]